MPALIFDLDDTLYDQSVPFVKALESFLDLDSDLMFNIYQASRGYSDHVFEQAQTKAITMAEMYIYRLKHAFLDYGISLPDQRLLEIQDCYAYNQGQIRLDEGMVALLDYCKENDFKLGLITNGPHQHQLRKIESSGLKRWIPSENMLISGQIGFAKPSPMIFKILEDRLGLDKSKTYYLGDSFANDVVGAKAAGWQAIWFNRRRREGSQSQFQADYILETSAELLQLIQKLP